MRVSLSLWETSERMVRRLCEMADQDVDWICERFAKSLGLSGKNAALPASRQTSLTWR
jgi:hypothetical protein